MFKYDIIINKRVILNGVIMGNGVSLMSAVVEWNKLGTAGHIEQGREKGQWVVVKDKGLLRQLKLLINSGNIDKNKLKVLEGIAAHLALIEVIDAIKEQKLDKTPNELVQVEEVRAMRNYALANRDVEGAKEIIEKTERIIKAHGLQIEAPKNKDQEKREAAARKEVSSTAKEVELAEKQTEASREENKYQKAQSDKHKKVRAEIDENAEKSKAEAQLKLRLATEENKRNRKLTA